MSRNEKDTNVPYYIPIVAGGISGTLTRFVCQPLDVIKIRFQLQVEPINTFSAESKYQSIPQAVRLIVREEGLAALWKGHLPAQYLSITYGVVQFGVYDAMIRESKNYPVLANNKSTVEFASGFTAGCLSSIVTSPFDIVRTRLIIQGKNKAYTSLCHGMNQIRIHEGYRGFFKGLSATLIQIGPLSGLQFASFNLYKRLLMEYGLQGNLTSKWMTVSATVLAGSMAGFTAKILTYPLDLFRKRMQFQGFQQARKGFGKNFTCNSLTSCLVETLRFEKGSGLYKGLAPSLLKSSVVNALIFTLYEETYNFLISLHKGS